MKLNFFFFLSKHYLLKLIKKASGAQTVAKSFELLQSN